MSAKKKLIGIFDYTSHSTHLYYARLASEILANEEGYDLVSVDNLELLQTLPLDGILFREEINFDRSILENLHHQGVSIVAINSRDDLFPALNSDFESGTAEAIEHLQELGRSKIAYINASSAESVGKIVQVLVF